MLKFFGGLGLSLLVYTVMALLIFGDFFAPAVLMIVFPDRLGAPFWTLLLIASAALGMGAVVLAGRHGWRAPYRMPLFVGVWMGCSILSVGLYAEAARGLVLTEFRPDAYVERSFFRSIREAPREFQSFLHAAALKDCKPYAWSYRQMGFYELPANVAVNVVPADWVRRCAIERTE